MSEHPTYLIHYGIKGQKWGDRRYQNEDGSLTEEGKRRYANLGDYKSVSSNKHVRKLGKLWANIGIEKNEFARTSKKYIGPAGNQIMVGDESKLNRARRKAERYANFLVNHKGYNIKDMDNEFDDKGYMRSMVVIERKGKLFVDDLPTGYNAITGEKKKMK